MPKLSNRGEKAGQSAMPEYLLRSFQAWEDEYDSKTNPEGYINLSVAENLLSLPDVAKALSSAPPVPVSNLTYGTPGHFNSVMARFLSTYITGTEVSPEHVVNMNGATCVLEACAMCLCDPGDAVLTTGPGYRSLEYDVGTRAGAKIVIASLDDGPGDGPPVMTVEALEQGWEAAGGEASRIRMVIICSPNNPTGEVLSRQLIKDIVMWARGKDVHVIFDEIYARSVFDEDKTFVSVAEVLDGDLGDNVHIVWSFSKDFGISGARLGVLYSQNAQLLQCLSGPMWPFYWSSRHTQWAVEHFLSDDAWMEKYFDANRSRLSEAYKKFTGILDDMNIPYMRAEAGFFVWIDLRKWMNGETEEDEMVLWNQLCDARVLLTPASQCFGKRYGFFRICFAAVESETLESGCRRIEENL